MARAPEIVRRTLRDERLEILHDGVHHVRADEAVVPVLRPKARGECGVPGKTRGNARERTTPAEVRLLYHLAYNSVQVRQATIVEVRRGERGVVHWTRQYVMVDSGIGAARSQMMTGPANESLRHARSGEPPVVEELLPDLGAPHVVGKARRKRHEKTRSRHVDSKLRVERRTRGDRLRLKSGRLRGGGLTLRALVQREKPHSNKGKYRARADYRPLNPPRHLGAPFSDAKGTDTPSTFSMSGNSGHHTRAVAKSERNIALYSFK